MSRQDRGSLRQPGYGVRGPRPGFGRRPGPMSLIGEKPKDFRGTVRKLIAYIAAYRVPIAVVLLSAAGSTVFNIVGPRILSRATTELFNGLVAKIAGTGGIEFGKISRILSYLLVLYAVSAAFNIVQGWIMTGVSQQICFKMRREISEKINRMPLKYFESNTVGEVLSRITNDVDTLGQSLNQSITQIITSLVTIIGVLAMMLSISPLMTLVALAILPISAGLVSVVVKLSQKHFRAQQEFLGKINGQIEEVYSAHNVVKAFNREEAALGEFNRTNRVLFESAWKSQFVSGMMHPIMMLVGNLGYVAVAVVGGVLAVRGTITVGDIQAFIQYVRSFTQPITQFAQVSTMLQSMAAAAERVFEFLGEEEEDLAAADPAPTGHIRGAVKFDHVRFGYTPDKSVISDLSFEVRPGQMVAIVGPTGAGKTTIVKLLMRFYDVGSGSIEIDGCDVRRYDRRKLRECFGMVLQETWLFKGTIMENIRYGRPTATDAEVIEAAKAAHAHHFIETLPGGYGMELSEDGTNLSQGQRQLLTIARAILADRSILILDEATSNVDTLTEARIREGTRNLMKGRTSFVIAHRLSTIRHADLVLVLKDGDIVEQGTHETLIKKGGFYASLYYSQFEATSA